MGRGGRTTASNLKYRKRAKIGAIFELGASISGDRHLLLDPYLSDSLTVKYAKGESARLARLIGAKIVIPHHYDMFTFNTADPQDFIRAAESEKQAYQVLSCGERWSSSMLEFHI